MASQVSVIIPISGLSRPKIYICICDLATVSEVPSVSVVGHSACVLLRCALCVGVKKPVRLIPFIKFQLGY